MQTDLAPMRRAEVLLEAQTPVDDIVVQLTMLFGLDYVDSLAAVAAVVLLNERGMRVPAEQPVWSRTA